MTKELSVLDPDLKDIVNMSMNKKDLLDMVEADTLNELEETGRVLEGKIETVKGARETCLAKQTELCLSCCKKQFDEFKKAGVSINRALGTSIPETVTTSLSSSVYKNNSGKLEDLIGCIVKIQYSMSIDTSDGSDRTHITYRRNFTKGMTTSEVKKYAGLMKKNQDLYKELQDLCNLLNKNTDDIKNLPKRVRAVSAKLSRKALSSSAKGKEVLKLLDSLRGK